MTHEELIARLRENADLDAAEHVPHEVVQMQYDAADALEAADKQAEEDRVRIAALEKAVRDTEEMRGATIRDLEYYREHLTAANQREQALLRRVKELRGLVETLLLWIDDWAETAGTDFARIENQCETSIATEDDFSRLENE